jgi:uncharacterized membrane protein YoaK (UPF0700 family)
MRLWIGSSQSDLVTDAPGSPSSVAVPSVDSSLGLQLLPSVLSLTAGSVDIISFLALGGLFTAHITGNLVILAAHIVAGEKAGVALLLSVPVFILVLVLARLLAAGLEVAGLATLRPLLLLQFLLLAGFCALCLAAGARIDPNAPTAVLGGLLGVAAMAVQNALVQISLWGAPSTAVITTNITRFTMDVGEVLLGRDPATVARAGNRARHTWPAIAGFIARAALGAACFAAAGRWSLPLPAALALFALALGLYGTYRKRISLASAASVRFHGV